MNPSSCIVKDKNTNRNEGWYPRWNDIVPPSWPGLYVILYRKAFINALSTHILWEENYLQSRTPKDFSCKLFHCPVAFVQVFLEKNMIKAAKSTNWGLVNRLGCKLKKKTGHAVCTEHDQFVKYVQWVIISSGMPATTSRRCLRCWSSGCWYCIHYHHNFL